MVYTLISGYVFVLVFIVSLMALREMQFRGIARFVLAVCVAALSALGVTGGIPASDGDGAGSDNFLLLPYKALGVILLLLPLVLLFALIIRGIRTRTAKHLRPSTDPVHGGDHDPVAHAHNEQPSGQRVPKKADPGQQG